MLNFMSTKALFCSIMLGLLTHVMGPPVSAAGADEKIRARPFNTQIVQSGHSLTGPIPEILKKMVRASTVQRGIVIDRSTIPGSPMDWRWKNAPDGGKPDARADIGNYELLVLTERVPLSNTLAWHNSEAEALRWFVHAWSQGNDGQGAETILYATWVHISSGPDYENPYKDPEGHIPFRDRLPREMRMWEQILDYVNTNRPSGSPAMQIIPGPLIMAAAYDDISLGKAPQINDISELFGDEIHLNDKGKYLIALAHYSVIYGRNPKGLPHNLGLDHPPSRAQALWMQELVWRVISAYSNRS